MKFPNWAPRWARKVMSRSELRCRYHIRIPSAFMARRLTDDELNQIGDGGKPPTRWWLRRPPSDRPGQNILDRI